MKVNDASLSRDLEFVTLFRNERPDAPISDAAHDSLPILIGQRT
jgi:hypothetical protein